MRDEEKLEEMGLVLPGPPKIPEGVRLPFAWVRVRGDRAYVSGHGLLGADGSLSGPSGRWARRSYQRRATGRRTWRRSAS